MLKEKIAKLINVKSIISILLTIVFCYLSVVGVVAAELFITIFSTVIAFYFGTQMEKKNQTTTE
ncbi:MAG: hypothetical protein IKT27_03055 [Clostridia bacterium]|nr:hypothetical protein [Clostridia bacterium]